jgi:hypothetical protein
MQDAELNCNKSAMYKMSPKYTSEVHSYTDWTIGGWAYGSGKLCNWNRRGKAKGILRAVHTSSAIHNYLRLFNKLQYWDKNVNIVHLFLTG